MPKTIEQTKAENSRRMEQAKARFDEEIAKLRAMRAELIEDAKKHAAAMKTIVGGRDND